MPSFISKQGKWSPAKEKYFDEKTGDMVVGDDRAAVEFMKENGGDVGQDALKDPQLLQASRNAGFNKLQDYLDHFAPSPKQVEETKAAQEIVVTHAKKRGRPVANHSTKGGFFDEKSSPEQELAKKG